MLRVATKPEMLIHGLLQEIGQIFQVQGRKVTSFILQPHHPEGPFRIFLLFETTCPGQEIGFANRVSQRPVPSLQESHDRVNCALVLLLQSKNTSGIVRQADFPGCHLLKKLMQPPGWKYFQNHFQAQINLHGINSFRVQKTFQIHHRRVRCIQLRKRWCHQQHLRGNIHYLEFMIKQMYTFLIPRQNLGYATFIS